MKRTADGYRKRFREYLESCVVASCLLAQGAFDLGPGAAGWHQLEPRWDQPNKWPYAPKNGEPGVSRFHVSNRVNMNANMNTANITRRAVALVEHLAPNIMITCDLKVHVTHEAGKRVVLQVIEAAIIDARQNGMALIDGQHLRARRTLVTVGIARAGTKGNVLRAGAWLTDRAKNQRAASSYVVFEGLRLAVADLRDSLHAGVGKKLCGTGAH